MATVFLGSLEGALGFRQLVAIKRPHPHLLEEPGFRDALLREARLAAGIHHANVVDVRDVEIVGDTVQLVMDYIEGASLGELVGVCAREGKRIPPGVALRIVLDACAGLHAAHELVDDAGRPVGLVHRDVSPQNVLVGVDGVARVTDFGIAKCMESSEPGTSRETLKGKVGYMAPEYVRGDVVDRRVDVFALGVVLWEALCGRRLFRGASDAETLERVLSASAPPVSEAAPELAALDAAVARSLERDPSLRYPTTEDMARELERAATSAGVVAGSADVARFVRETLGPRLEERRRALREVREETRGEAPLRGAGSTTQPGETPSSPPPAVTPIHDPTATVREPASRPRPTSRLPIVLAAAGVLLVGSGAAALVLWKQPAPASVVAAQSPSALPALTPEAAASVAPAPPAETTADPPAASHPALRPAPGKRSHQPPPNPYPGGP